MLLALLWLWTLGAVYFMVGGSRSVSGGLAALAYLVLTAVILWRFRSHAWIWVLCTFALGALWFLRVQPRTDRDWRPEVARMPTAEFHGDKVTIRNVRNFRYRTEDDFDIDYYDKEYDLDDLESVDLVMCYWDGNTAIAHTMLSFGFKGGEYLCLSVEIRREKGENWGGLPGIYKQFEILYILADERDIINLRTGYRGEDLYLYRMRIGPADIRLYLEATLRLCNKLSREPEFYDTLEYNCTSALTHMAGELWPEDRRPRGLKSLLNGRADQDAYHREHLDQALPFEELRERSYITPVGRRLKDDPDFSRKLREGLPGLR